MELVDSHCHLDLLDLRNEGKNLSHLLEDARAQNVVQFLCVSVDLNNYSNMLALTNQYSDVYATVGLHPVEAVSQEPSVQDLISYAQNPKVLAIGETGLDFFHQDTSPEVQIARFKNHIAAAKECQKPLVIHTRDAKDETIKILRSEGAEKVGGVLHCFTEDWEMATQAMDLGFYISFSGIVTFKNAFQLQEIAKKIPLESMLIETDAPYLAPVPHRGKTNQPAYVRYVAEYIAYLRNEPLALIADHTTQNFRQLFHLPSKLIE